jgi:hypothetical protein
MLLLYLITDAGPGKGEEFKKIITSLWLECI